MSRRRVIAAALSGGLIAAVTGAPSPVHSAPITVALCAKAGSVTMPDGVAVDIWGYAEGTCATAGPATLPGPTIEITEGDTLTIDLDVDASLGAEAVSVVVAAADGRPDVAGVDAGGGTVSYDFDDLEPGAYLYESGVNASIQVPMGLYGALVVHSADAGTAYGATTNTAFEVEAVLVTSELDVDLNNAADPSAFNLNDHAPEYFLINGQAHPATATIAALPGDRVLLRYLNAGLLNHSMSLLGLHQQVIGRESRQLAHRRTTVAELVAAGQTADSIATVPVSAMPGTRFPLYNRNGRLTNNLAAGGGMLTFIDVVAPPPPPPPPLLLSFEAPGTAGPVVFGDEDIVRYDGTAFSLAFDGSAEGLLGNADVDAIEVLGPSDYLLSFNANVGTVIPDGVGTVDDSDVVRFNAGTFSLFFDGSLVGLTTDAEDVDEIELLAGGALLVSTFNNPDVPGVTGEVDEDLLRFTPTVAGNYAAGTWSLWFDGSDVGLATNAGEDVDGASFLPTGDLLLSTLDAFAVTGVSGADEDVFVCQSLVTTPGSTAATATTSCSFAPTLWFDGSALGVTGPVGDPNNNVDGIG